MKEEYEILRDKIIEHMKKTDQWGKFFPMALSPFAYNETPAQVFMPLAKEAVLERGWRWRHEDKKEYELATLGKIPDSLSEVKNEITKEILACQTCGKNYRIIMQELKFYRQMNLPIPRLCPECRNRNRIAEDNPRQVFSRRCSNCQETIDSPYGAERPETVYCEKCYLRYMK